MKVGNSIVFRSHRDSGIVHVIIAMESEKWGNAQRLRRGCSRPDEWNYLTSYDVVLTPVNCVICIGATPP